MYPGLSTESESFVEEKTEKLRNRHSRKQLLRRSAQDAEQRKLPLRLPAQLKQQLVEFLDSVESAVIDCSQLENLDTSILQLLLALQKTGRCQFETPPESGSIADQWVRLSGLKDSLFVR